MNKPRTPEQEALADEIWAAYGKPWPLPLYTATREHVWYEFRRRGYTESSDIPKFITAVGFDRWYEAEHGEPGDWPPGWQPVEYKYVNVYVTDQAYGGPEEGGWWYEVGEPRACVPVAVDLSYGDCMALARELYKALNIELDPEKDYRGFVTRIESGMGEPYPMVRPHYE